MISTNRPLFRRALGTVTVTFLLGATLAACSGGDDKKAAPAEKSTTTTVARTTTTTTPPLPRAPLTGLEDPSGQSLTRPAVSVKVENTPDARPQGGLDQADVVYEEVVEGNITRLVAMFNSQVPDVIGPVRSVRAIDPDIVWPLGGIFAFSGGAPINVEAAQAAPVTVVTENDQDVLVRNAPGQPPRGAPHNLYALGPPLFGVGAQPVPSPALFQYYLPSAGVGADPGVNSIRVGFQAGYDPTWVWDPGSWSWKRFIQGEPSHRGVGQPDRRAERGRAVHRVPGRGRRHHGGRGRRVGVHRRAGARRALAAPRPWAAGALRRQRRRADPVAAGHDLGGAPAQREPGRRGIRAAAPTDHRAAHDGAADHDHGQEGQEERFVRPVTWPA